jgi:DNA-binding MarR family transcriptional regulator
MAFHETSSAYFLMDTTIKRARQLLDKAFENAYVDLTADQWVLLECLSRKEEMTQQELAECAEKDPSTVTRIIDILINKGYIRRYDSPLDRRSKLVTLTENGKSTHQKALVEAGHVRQAGFINLTAEEYRVLCEALRKIHSSIQLSLEN